MNLTKTYMRALALVIIVAFIAPAGVVAQDAEESAQPTKFSKEDLAQMLAPIALYPDSLLSQILMASTYPLEVVEADRWVEQNPSLQGDKLDDALKEKDWDVSVKSLCNFPKILKVMSDKLAQTAKLGDAFLAQEEDVMDMIQELRHKAQEAGNLKTTEQQKVVVQDQYIEIKPADSQMVYVPVYNPLYVYGPWWYPAYPPYYWYYPGPFIASGIIGFGFGVGLGFGFFPWSGFDWHHHGIHVDFDRTRRFHRDHFDGRETGWHTWRHSPEHRRGVVYRDRATSQHFGQSPAISREARRGARGYGEKFGWDTQTRGSFQGNVERGNLQRGETGRFETRRSTSRENAFGGAGNGNFERRASDRGFSSRESSWSRGGGQVRSGHGTRGGGEIRSGGGTPGGGGFHGGGGFRGGGFGGGRR
ncbi:MAG: hypothetical protein A2169_06610 [Deltaproteobacteria bacterium RBG_13_47_9]|nr:MAG: hypothetical protein A2169_06610 [Deltaproteobacteria bacterium RBG_13_47_9]